MAETKKSRLEKARQIIDRNVMNTPFQVPDIDEMNGTLDTDFAGFVRRRNPEFPGDPRHLHVDEGDGQWYAFSWKKAIEQPSEEQQWKRAMRAAGDELRRQFKDEVDEHVCHECGEQCRNTKLDKATVDETPPLDDLIKSYVQQYGWPKFDNQPDAMGWVFVNIDEEARFLEWCVSRWALRILCRSCNSSKGKSEAPKTSKEDRRRRYAERKPKTQPDLFA